MTPTNKRSIAQGISFPGMILAMLYLLQACQPVEEGIQLLITTDRVEYVSEGSYRITGTLDCMADQEITDHGICWSDSEDPDIECSSIELGPPSSMGKFSVIADGLAASTTYYFRAYAVVHSAPEYADELAYTTRPAAENMVIDVDGNIYKVVQIGEQTWMAENLKVTRYSDKTPIPRVTTQPDWYDLKRESKAYCWYDTVLTNGYVYGGLYTWPAAVGGNGLEGSDLVPSGIQGVCPDGWHLPSDAEWKQLEMHLGMSQEEADTVKWRGADQGGKLKQFGTGLWENPNYTSDPGTGFDALPGGYRHASGLFYSKRTSAYFWTSSGRGYGFGWYRRLDNQELSVYRYFEGVYYGHSVRCVKD